MALTSEQFDNLDAIIKGINFIQSFIFLILYIKSYRTLKATLVDGISKYLQMIMRTSILLAAAYFLRYVLSLTNHFHPIPHSQWLLDLLFIVGHSSFYLVMMLRLHFVFRGTKYGLSKSTERVLLISWMTIVLCDGTYFIAKANSSDIGAISYFFFQLVILDIMFAAALINIFTQKLTRMGICTLSFFMLILYVDSIFIFYELILRQNQMMFCALTFWRCLKEWKCSGKITKWAQRTRKHSFH